MKKGLFIAAASLLLMTAGADASDECPDAKEILKLVKESDGAKEFVVKVKKMYPLVKGVVATTGTGGTFCAAPQKLDS